MKMDRREFLAGISAFGVAGAAGSKTLFASAASMKSSKVIRRKGPFSNTLDKQTGELATDPLVLRFKKAREKLKKGPFYPKYHFLLKTPM